MSTKKVLALPWARGETLDKVDWSESLDGCLFQMWERAHAEWR